MEEKRARLFCLDYSQNHLPKTGAMVTVNLYPLKCKKSSALNKQRKGITEEAMAKNEEVILEAAKKAAYIVMAHGHGAAWQLEGNKIKGLLKKHGLAKRVYYLKSNEGEKQPVHPMKVGFSIKTERHLPYFT